MIVQVLDCPSFDRYHYQFKKAFSELDDDEYEYNAMFNFDGSKYSLLFAGNLLTRLT